MIADTSHLRIRQTMKERTALAVLDFGIQYADYPCQ